jgi:hypothetical protein
MLYLATEFSGLEVPEFADVVCLREHNLLSPAAHELR